MLHTKLVHIKLRGSEALVSVVEKIREYGRYSGSSGFFASLKMTSFRSLIRAFT